MLFLVLTPTAGHALSLSLSLSLSSLLLLFLPSAYTPLRLTLPPTSHYDHQDESTPEKVVLLETYKDETALTSHGATAHVNAWRAGANDLCSRSKAEWRAVGSEAPGRLLPDDASQGACAVTLVDAEVRAEELGNALEAVEALAKTITGEGMRCRVLQVR